MHIPYQFCHDFDSVNPKHQIHATETIIYPLFKCNIIYIIPGGHILYNIILLIVTNGQLIPLYPNNGKYIHSLSLMKG